MPSCPLSTYEKNFTTGLYVDARITGTLPIPHDKKLFALFLHYNIPKHLEKVCSFFFLLPEFLNIVTFKVQPGLLLKGVKCPIKTKNNVERYHNAHIRKVWNGSTTLANAFASLSIPNGTWKNIPPNLAYPMKWSTLEHYKHILKDWP